MHGAQEIGFFDTEATSGTIMNALNEDCNAVQSAMSERACAPTLHLPHVGCSCACHAAGKALLVQRSCLHVSRSCGQWAQGREISVGLSL